MLEQYIRLQNARFQRPFHYQINIDEEIEPSKLYIPSLLLQPLVENAINHGLFHKGAEGRLLISFQKGRSENDLICIIDDNGIGRSQSKELQKSMKRENASYGSTLTGELIDIFKKYEQMDIQIEYVDKQPPATGVIVKLILKNVPTVEE